MLACVLEQINKFKEIRCRRPVELQWLAQLLIDMSKHEHSNQFKREPIYHIKNIKIRVQTVKYLCTNSTTDELRHHDVKMGRREDATTHQSQQQKKHYWNATNTIHTSTNNTRDPSNHHNRKSTQLKVND